MLLVLSRSSGLSVGAVQFSATISSCCWRGEVAGAPAHFILLGASLSSTPTSPSLTSTNFFFALHHSCYATPTFTFTTFHHLSPPSARLSNPRLTIFSSSSKFPLPNRPLPASSLDTPNSYLPLPQPTPFSLPTSQLPRPRQHRRARPTSTLTKPLLQRPLTLAELLLPPFRLCPLLFDTGS